MSIGFNDNIKVLTGKPIDSRYTNVDGDPYIDVAQVYSQIPLAYRYIGLTVFVIDKEYWFKNDIDTLIEKSGGGGGDTESVILANNITLSGTEYGNYKSGDTIVGGTTLQTMFEQMMILTVEPTFDLTPNSQIIEIGNTISFNLNSVFNQNDAGVINLYTLDKVYNSVSSNLVSSASIIAYDDTTTQVILEGAELEYTAIVSYDASAILPLGSIEDITTITGVRAYFNGSSTDTSTPTTSTQIRALNDSGLNPQNGTTFTINIAVGSTRVVFAYPATLQDVSSVKYVELGNGEVKDTFTQTQFIVEGANGESGINYKIYTYIPAVPYGGAATYNVTI